MSGPIRGLHDVEGQLFAVSGRTLYQISNAGVAIPRGTIPGVGRVSMAHNQRSTGNELIVVNGSGGYVWNTGTQAFSIITDAGYPGASVVDFIDGYLMQVEPFGRFLFHSDLADALEYNTLDRFEAETAPDRTLGMIVNHQEVWAFGERTIDVFGNAGTAQGTFQNKGVSISRGCAAKWSPAVIDNGVAWMGDDLKVYHANGYSPVRISTRAVEVALSECSRTDLRNAFSFVWEDLSHAVYYLTVPNGPTFGYDFSTGLWHRRSSWHPERDLTGRWRINDLVKHNGRWIGGDYQTGKLYTLDWDYMLEGCEPLVRERVSPVAHNDGRGFVVDSVETFFETGGKEAECVEFPYQPQGPSISGEAPDGRTSQPYGPYTYTVTAGDGEVVSVEVISGELPVGLAFDEGEIQAGTPTSRGSYTFTIRVTDSNGLWATHTDTIEVAMPIVFAQSVSNANAGLILGSFDGVAFPTTHNTGLDRVTHIYQAGGAVFAFDSVAKRGRVSFDGCETFAEVEGLVQTDGASVNGVAHSNGVWCFVYQLGGVISRSQDGIAFVDVAVPARARYAIAGRGDTFVAGGSNGFVTVSTTAGETWVEYQIPLNGQNNLGVTAVIDTGGAFLLSRTSSVPAYRSVNGLDGSWAPVSHGLSGGGAILIGVVDATPRRVIAASGTNSAFSVDDGVTFAPGGTTTASGTPTPMASSHLGAFFGSQGSGLQRTPDGVSWQQSLTDRENIMVAAISVPSA